MTKAMKKAIETYNTWVERDTIYKTFEHEDYDDCICYEDIEGDVVVLQKDEDGNIIDAWQE